MKRKIINIGNSYGIIIPKGVIKAMDWYVKELDLIIDTKKKEIIIKK